MDRKTNLYIFLEKKFFSIIDDLDIYSRARENRKIQRIFFAKKLYKENKFLIPDDSITFLVRETKNNIFNKMNKINKYLTMIKIFNNFLFEIEYNKTINLKNG